MKYSMKMKKKKDYCSKEQHGEISQTRNGVKKAKKIVAVHL